MAPPRLRDRPWNVLCSYSSCEVNEGREEGEERERERSVDSNGAKQMEEIRIGDRERCYGYRQEGRNKKGRWRDSNGRKVKDTGVGEGRRESEGKKGEEAKDKEGGPKGRW
jgi:hypothetical protein